jgi:heme-degrading monooxygenase HmoA
MSVFVIWESRFPPEAAADGRRVTESVWQDMPGFVGYQRHMLMQDLDDPGHLFVVSEWERRAAADEIRDHYADNENAKRAESLVAEPRRRTVARALTGSE